MSTLLAPVEWAYEDELPEDITDEEFSAMFKQSKVDMVRLYPYVVIQGHRYYLT